MYELTKRDYTTGTETTEQRAIGRTLYVTYKSVQVMSDIFEEHLVAVSVDDNGRLTETSVSGWYGSDKSGDNYEVDATEQAWEDYRARCELDKFNKLEARELTLAESPAVKGRVVKIVKGRNGKGLVGKVVVVMDAYYGMGYRSVEMKKLGVATSPRKVTVTRNGREYENYADMVWAWECNCEVENPAPVDTAPLRKEAQEYAASCLEGQARIAAANIARYGKKKVAA